MKCHKCGFVSFDYLADCKKCGINLEGSRSLLGMLDFKPTMPFFLGAMINARSAGANGGSAGPDLRAPLSAGFGEVDFGGDLEFEIEEDVQAASGRQGGQADHDLFPHIDLPEGFSLSFGEEEKSDDFELNIGPEFEQALTLELNAKDLESQGGPAAVQDDLADFRFEGPLDLSPEAPVAETAASDVDSLIPELALDISLDLDPIEPKLASDFLAAEPAAPGNEDIENGLVIDFSQNDLNSLLLELDDKPSET